jgi:hypothetical protein
VNGVSAPREWGDPGWLRRRHRIEPGQASKEQLEMVGPLKLERWRLGDFVLSQFKCWLTELGLPIGSTHAIHEPGAEVVRRSTSAIHTFYSTPFS